MNGPVLLLCLLGFLIQGSMPFFFLKRGRFSLRWFATAAPFFVDGLALVGALGGAVTPVAMPGAIVLTYFAVPIVATALVLLGCTFGVHRVPPGLWHQNDAPATTLVTYGPYARIRHPIYAAFLLLLIATALALPHVGTLLMLIVGAMQLVRAARHEERRLLESFVAEYAAYMQRTGSFLPRLSGGGAARTSARSYAERTEARSR
jgi:protein-S-isoprenylcysteine O-methyltransferase Ste14